MKRKLNLYQVRFDFSLNIFETLFKTVYSENLSFPENKKYEWYLSNRKPKIRRYYIESEFSYKGKKSNKMQFSGDIDFNYYDGRKRLYNSFDLILKETEKDNNRKKEVEDTRTHIKNCRNRVENVKNVSIMPVNGNLQSLKQAVGRDRLDTFTWCLDMHFRNYKTNGESILFNYCAPAYFDALKSFLNLFDNIYEYFECVYHIDDKFFVNELIESGAKPIDTIERINKYLYLTERFWHKKAVGYLEKGLDKSKLI